MAKPADAGFEIDYARAGEFRIGFEGNMKTKLTFVYKEDFQDLIDEETSANKCYPLPVEIRRECDGEEKIVGTAELHLVDGEWNLDNCTIEVELRMFNPYTCYEDNAEAEIDLFEASDNHYTVRLLRGGLEYVHYSSTGYDNDEWNPLFFPEADPQTKGWVFWKFEHVNTTNTSTYYYVRERIVAPTVTTPDMIPLSGTYVRKPILYAYRIIGAGPGSRPNRRGQADAFIYPFEYSIFGSVAGQSIDNGMLLTDVLAYFANKFCGVQVVSDFFQINPDTASSVNYVTGETSMVNKILLFNKSDIKRHDAKNNATRAMTTFEKILEGLCKMFNCQYRFTESELRIEHVSHPLLQARKGLDVTIDSKYADYISGMRRYTYDTLRLPAREKCTFMEANYADFVGVPISYIGQCVTKEKSARERKVEVEDITTDLMWVMENPDSESKNVEDEGIFMMAVFTDGGVNYPVVDLPILDAQARPNNHLGWAQLHEHYWRHDRFQYYGYMNNNYTTFESVKPIKKGRKFTIPFGCDDTINLNSIVVTPLGDGIVNTATHNLQACTLELELLYPDDQNVEPTCLAPELFAFDHRDEADFYFNTQLPTSPQSTVIEITYPSGLVLEQTLTDSDGVSFVTVDPLIDGVYKFRKRCKCGSLFSAWTPFISVPVTLVTAPIECLGLAGTLQKNGRGLHSAQQGNTTIFNLIYDNTAGDFGNGMIEVEISKPKDPLGIVDIGYDVYTKPQAGYARVVGNLVYFSVDVSNPALPSQRIYNGKWRFRIRKKCAEGLYSEYTPTLILKVK
jgi:hypothetical protein